MKQFPTMSRRTSSEFQMEIAGMTNEEIESKYQIRREYVPGKIAAGGKVHMMHGRVATFKGEEYLISAICGCGARGGSFGTITITSTSDKGEKCAKCFPDQP